MEWTTYTALRKEMIYNTGEEVTQNEEDSNQDSQ